MSLTSRLSLPFIKFFNYVSYLIGGEVFTLQDIENGVLRGNRKGLAQLRRPFSKTDPRLQVLDYSVKTQFSFSLTLTQI